MLFSQNNGSAILAVLFYVTTFTIIVASLLQWSIVEYRSSERFILRTQAQNAAESVINSGMAQLMYRWQMQTSFANDELSEDNQPLIITESFTDLFEDTSIDLDTIEITGGTIPVTSWAYIDPNDPDNENDSQKGFYVFARNIPIVAKAAAITEKGDEITVYAGQTFQMRDTPLFSYAIFYNMTLEFYPSPTMNVYGPVHTNQDLWVDAANNLYFHELITAAGEFRHGILETTSPGGTLGGDIWFKDSDGNFVSNYKGSGSRTLSTSYYDSLYTVDGEPAWENFALETWDGSIKSEEHNVAIATLVGYKDYVRDDPDTPTVLDDDLNYAYAIIEPNLLVTNSDYKGGGEQAKFAQKAGLIIRLHESDPPVHAHSVSSNYYVSFNKLLRVNTANPNSDPDLDTDGNVQEIPITVSSSFVSEVINVEEYDESWWSSSPRSGFYDQRQDRGMDFLEIDIEDLREGIDDTDSNYDPSVWTQNYTPENDYNGVIYVEFPIDTTAGGGSDGVVVAKNNFALLLSDATTIPNPNYNDVVGRDPGFTVATNGMLYTLGNYNSDGNLNTGSATDPDDSGDPDPPAALIADSITILSSNWDHDDSKKSLSYRSAQDTEVSAALLAGIVPANKEGSGNWSGAVNNLPRLLEDWDGETLRIRGSMACLYESEIGGVFGGYGVIYGAPDRNFGYYTEFGLGKLPPGTPVARSFRPLNFRFITEEEYEVLLLEMNN